MTLTYRWRWTLNASPDALWPLLSDTQRLNQALGLPPVRFTDDPDPAGGTIRHGASRQLGMSMIWLEHPFEWIEGRELSVVRDYDQGPMRRMRARLAIEPATRGTRVEMELELDPASALSGLYLRLAVRGIHRQVGRALEQLERFLSHRTPVPFTLPPPQLLPVARSRLAQAGARLLDDGFPNASVELLTRLLEGAPDGDLNRMRPFEIADRAGRERLEILRLFLKATRLGVLDLSWDLLCPACRGATRRAASLSGLSHEAHCNSCNVRFDVRFDQSVEVTFRPNEAIRPLSVFQYCVGGPGNTPHIAVQRRVAPGAAIDVPIPLAPGQYRLRGPKMESTSTLEVTAPGEAPTTGLPALHLTRSGPGVYRLALPSGAMLRLENGTGIEQLVIIERLEWFQNAATASLVTSFQDFRDLFSSEVLKPDEQIQVASLAFLFSDLKSSTALYEQIGDAPAFALVRDHFDVLFEGIRGHEGAVVKTIGDAVMAVFTDPTNALRAALWVQARLEATGLARNGIVLKLGVHAGPCLVVNLDNRLDYFGTTVNMAARIQSESAGGEVVLADSLAREPGVAALLAGVSHRREVFRRSLKGLTGELDLVRIWPGAG